MEYNDRKRKVMHNGRIFSAKAVAAPRPERRVRKGYEPVFGAE